MTIRLLQPVADDAAGVVRELDTRRALRLIRLGYAEAVEMKPPKKRKDD